MKLMDKIDELIKPSSGKLVISITGGGGKTTTLIALGQYYRAKKNRVLITTTTKLQAPRFFNFRADHVFTDESAFFNHTSKEGETVFFAEKHILNAKKVISPRDEVLPLLSRNYDVVIIEADGARSLPCKIHNERDPIITKETTSVIAMAGLSSFNDMAANVCMGESSTRTVDLDYYQNLIDDKEGLLKGVEEKHKAIIFFNQSDLVSDEVVKGLKELKTSLPIVVGAIKKNRIV